jgi:integrating conjugative element protein (TIGR03755 family)
MAVGNILVKQLFIEDAMKKLCFLILFSITLAALASDIIPTGNNNNFLYYKIGGGTDFALPPVQDTQTIQLNSTADLSAGYSCGAFNPVLSIANSLNDLKNNVDNIEQAILNNATGSLVEMPMYWLAQANPTAYNLINNHLRSAHNEIEISTKSCQDVKNQIAQGKNPYQDWGTLSVNHQWKQHLSLTAMGKEDINEAKKAVDQQSGDAGVPWVQGNKKDDGTFYAGGSNQPPVHVISDTVKAGYNAMLLRDVNDNDPAPDGTELAKQFSTPRDAMIWITNVVGDQTITTCNDPSCKNQQGGISGRGLLPWITTCNDQNKNYCADNIRTNLTNLVTGQTPITKDNLETVSASGLVMSPQVINAIRNMDSTQQGIMTTKLSQEIATQKVVDRAFIAKDILQTGSQVPVIAANKPAQTIIREAIQQVDKDIQALAFESQVRKQMMSQTIAEILTYQGNQQENAMNVSKVIPSEPLIENSAISNKGNNK